MSDSTNELLKSQFKDLKEQIRDGHATIGRELRELGTKTEVIGKEMVRLETEADATQKTLGKHDKTLYHEKEGHSITIDRLSQAEGNRKKHFGVLWTALVALTVERIANYFKGGA